MPSNAALSPLASPSALDANARPLADGASVATRENAFGASAASNVSTDVPAGTAPPFPPDADLPDAANENERSFSSTVAPSGVPDADFVDATGKIDWSAALSANESWLRSTIATQVGERAAVDEVFQDVALAATRQKAPIRDPRKIGAWLRRLATVYSLLYRRSLGRKRKLLQRYQDRVPVREVAGVDAEPLHWLLSEERRALVRQATALLSDDERRVLTLKYAEERSYKEIAEELGATVSAVQSKLHRARARLREKLAELAPTANAPPA